MPEMDTSNVDVDNSISHLTSIGVSGAQESQSPESLLHCHDQSPNSSNKPHLKSSKVNNKRKKMGGLKQAKKHVRGKLPNGTRTGDEDVHDVKMNINSRNVDSEDGDDSAHSNSIPSGSAEPSIGSSILDEVLSEKKKALLESAEMVDFLQSHIKSS